MSAFKFLLQICVKLEKIIFNRGPNDNSNNYDVNLNVIVFAKNVTSTNVGIGLSLNILQARCEKLVLRQLTHCIDHEQDLKCHD